MARRLCVGLSFIIACSGGDDETTADGAAGSGGAATDAGSAGHSAGTPSGGDDAGDAGGAATLGGHRDILETALQIDLDSNRGIATITLGAAPTAETAVTELEVGSLTIESVTLDGAPLRYVRRSDALVMEAPASREPIAITIEYGFSYQGTFDGWSSDFTYTWPRSCGNLFPCRSDPSEGSKFRLDLTGATSTLIYASEIASEGPAYMLAWAHGDYERLDLGVTSAGTSVGMWYLPGGSTAAEAGGRVLIQAFDWLEQQIGTYRFGADVGAVAVPWPRSATGGIEHHPYWHVAVESMGAVDVQIHEAAHGWFGNGVRLRCWEDFVLSEGTASYLTALILDELVGGQTTLTVWRQYEAMLHERPPANNRVAWPQSCGLVDVLDLYSPVVYAKGAFFYRAVEARVGRAEMVRALAAFYDRFAGDSAGMQDMLDVIAEITGYDPQRCAERWLGSIDVPVFEPCP